MHLNFNIQSRGELKMPALGLLALATQALCAVHVVRTGRPYWWIFLIVFVPLLGVVVYLAVELLPDLLGSRGARLATSGVANFLDPGRGLREAMLRKEITPTIQNKAALAEEYLAAGQPACSASLYRETLTGIHSTDPALMLGLARALFANGEARETQATLERLRATNPECTSAEGHLVYARSLELQDKADAALYEYAALVTYYPGQEARYRYALLLKKTGRSAEARKFLQEICQAIDYGPRHQYREQREWYDLARRELITEGGVR
jgi:hypothetical protein